MVIITKIAKSIWHIPRRIAAALVSLYQKTLSPDHGWLRALYPHGYCKFHPTCSEYTRQALLKKGLVVGVVMGMWRILRCNPCSKGGVDEVR